MSTIRLSVALIGEGVATLLSSRRGNEASPPSSPQRNPDRNDHAGRWEKHFSDPYQHLVRVVVLRCHSLVELLEQERYYFVLFRINLT